MKVTIQAREKLAYFCSECGASTPKWSGKCPDCGAWNSLNETVIEGGKAAAKSRFAGYAGSESVIQSLPEVGLKEEARIASGIFELDRVLGGGVVMGSVVLLGGDPGIGKSTLLLQGVVSLNENCQALYVTGEESLRQVGLRARRLGLQGAGLKLLSETRVERILEHAQREKPGVMVVDSIQTIYSDMLQSAPGSVTQVRESSAQLVRFAKQTNTAIFLVGHVTKEGSLAGPRVLEHMVDTVLYFEGDTGSRFRMVRAVKNRFGAVNELGVFAMTEKGLREVSNPCAIFLSRHQESSGSVVMVTREGSRPLLVEVQALVAESCLGNPRRVTVGLDQNRLSMLLAVLHRHGGIAMYDQDVFVNVVGGVRVAETGADLALLLAAVSSMRNQTLPQKMVVFGEVGLAGEIRPVQGGEERLKEAAKHGFTRAIVPDANVPKSKMSGMEVIAASHLKEAIEQI